MSETTYSGWRRLYRVRSWRARTAVAATLVGVALLSVLVVGIVNYVSARNLIQDTVENHLIDIGEARASRIEEGMEFVRDLAAFVAADEQVAVALSDFAAGFSSLDEPLDSEQVAELRVFYEDGIARVTPPGIEQPTVERFFPESDQARYLQYHYLLRNPFAPARAELDAAEDGSAYSAAHAEHHPVLREMLDETGLADLLMIDAATANVVYSVDKRVDFATNLASGPYSESVLAEAILEQLATAAVGRAVVVDFAPYVPADVSPTLFVAAAISDDDGVLGAVALQVPNEIVVDVTTAGQDWEGTGLGDTGEVYIVGPDSLMRSTSRLWLEDPEAYPGALEQAGYGPEIAEAVAAFDTTALIQPVRTDAVAAALRGGAFTGTEHNYLDRETFTVARGLDVPGVEWVMVADVATHEAYASLRSYLRRIGVIAAILVPLVGLIGIFLADRLMRPVRPIVEATRRVSGGELDVHLAAEGRDEFAELGRRFNGMVDALREQREDLVRTDGETSELLRAVLPSRLVDEVKRGNREVAEAVRNATLIAISAEIDPETAAAEADELLGLNVELQAITRRLAEGFSVEQLMSSASQQLFAAGLRTDDLGAEQAVDFVSEARHTAREFGEAHSVEVVFRAGLAAGDVVAGVIGTERIAFDVWGHPSRLAVALGAVAHPGGVLVDDAVVDAVGDSWGFEHDPGLVGLGGERLTGSYLRERKQASTADR